MDLDTKWLQDFIALSDLKNFSRAAELRHITQPAFGRHIKSLEEAVGQKLVDRETHPISLTPAGKQFRITARHLIQQLDHGINQLQGINQPVFNPLRISTPHSLASPTLMNLMEQSFLPKELAYSVDVLRVDFATESLVEGQCDVLFAFDILSLLQPPFQNICIGKGEFILVSGVNKQGEVIYTPDTKVAIPYLRYSAESYTARLIESHIGSELGFASQPCFESSMCQLHKDMAIRGKGVAWLPDCLIAAELANGQLIALDRQRWSVPYQMRLYRHQAALSQVGESFWQALHKQVEAGWTLLR